MRYLLDTHALIWIVTEDQKLSKKAKRIYLDNSNEIYLSAASVWEMAIKISLKKLTLEDKLSSFVDKHILGNNIGILNITADHALPLESLRYHHKDPFDRLIVAQCIQERLQLISKDPIFDSYEIRRVW